MAKNVSIRSYNESYKEKWDKFISEESCNGTFLQSRRFLDYHPKDRFEDSSLMFMNGETIIAVLPANIVTEPQKVLFSHQGSTFGGLVIGKKYNLHFALEHA